MIFIGKVYPPSSDFAVVHVGK